MAVSNNHSTASALPLAPTTATSNSGGNNIVTKVMNPSLLQFKLGACITGRMHIKGPPTQYYRSSTNRADEARKSVIYFNYRETAQFFSSDCSQCLKHQTSMWLSTSAIHLVLLQLRGLASN
uniref:Uncharacterized protein n=1 Tax=Oryza nivara TaxID=4536 RepID=A0A0E0HQY2_ORYNI